MLAARILRSGFKKPSASKFAARSYGTSATKSRSAIKPFVFAAAALGAAAGAYALYNMKKDEEKSKNTFVDSALLRFLPVASAQEQVPLTGLPGTKHERTFIAFKPDAVQRGLVGELIARFEAKGFKLVGIKVLVPTAEFAAKHYDDLKARPFFPGLCQYFSSGAVVAMVWEGKNAVVNGRKLVGATNPADAAPGSIRGDLAIDVGRNLIHGSDSIESAKAEISLWFTDKEVANYTHDTGNKWVYEK